jgi:hypothetical protein
MYICVCVCVYDFNQILATVRVYHVQYFLLRCSHVFRKSITSFRRPQTSHVSPLLRVALSWRSVLSVGGKILTVKPKYSDKIPVQCELVHCSGHE